MKGKQGAQRTDWLDLTKQQSNASCGGKKKGSSKRYDDMLVGQTLTMEEEKQFEKKQHQTSQVQTNTHETHIRFFIINRHESHPCCWNDCLKNCP